MKISIAYKNISYEDEETNLLMAGLNKFINYQLK